jgi:hypothetical protein
MRLAELERKKRIWTTGKKLTEYYKSNGDFFAKNGTAEAPCVTSATWMFTGTTSDFNHVTKSRTNY